MCKFRKDLVDFKLLTTKSTPIIFLYERSTQHQSAETFYFVCVKSRKKFIIDMRFISEIKFHHGDIFMKSLSASTYQLI